MEKFKENLAPLLLMLFIPAINIFYVLLNNAQRGADILLTKFDLLISFEPIFAVPYLAWYPFIILTMFYLCFKDRNTYYTTVLAYLMTLAASYLIFYVYQTTVPRPELVGNDIFTRMMAFIYSHDRPFNCFPSIHVSTSYLMMKALNISTVKNRFNSFIVNCGAILVIISTLFVKQHVVFDVIGGVLLGNILFDLVYHFNITGRFVTWYQKTLAPEKVDLELD